MAAGLTPACHLPAGTTIIGRIIGLPAGQHGFRVHMLGDLSNAPMSCGAVFDPIRGKKIGADHDRQAGDLGTITAGNDGVADVRISDRNVPLNGCMRLLQW